MARAEELSAGRDSLSDVLFPESALLIISPEQILNRRSMPFGMLLGLRIGLGDLRIAGLLLGVCL